MQNTKNSKKEESLEVLSWEDWYVLSSAGLAYCMFLHSSLGRCVWKVCVWLLLSLFLCIFYLLVGVYPTRRP